MGFWWLNNFLGMGQLGFMTEEDMQDIPHPVVELGIHVTFKTVQVGTLLGSVAGSIRGISKARKELRNWVKPVTVRQLVVPIFNVGRRWGAAGAIIGLAAGPAVTLATIQGKKLDDDGLYDRCYRLRNNRNQLTYDRLTLAGIVGFCGVSRSIRPFVLGHNVGFCLALYLNYLLHARELLNGAPNDEEASKKSLELVVEKLDSSEK